MPNITPEVLHEIAGKLISAKNKRDVYLSHLESLQNGRLETAVMDIKYSSRFYRSSGTIAMNSEEIRSVLESRLKELNTTIELFEKEFKDLTLS